MSCQNAAKNTFEIIDMNRESSASTADRILEAPQRRSGYDGARNSGCIGGQNFVCPLPSAKMADKRTHRSNGFIDEP